MTSVPRTGGRPFFDAVIVPTARASRHAGSAIDLAARSGSRLVVLCSRQSRPKEVAQSMSRANVQGMALTVPSGFTHDLLCFETDAFPEALYGRQSNDIAMKRNIGLMTARYAGWEKVLFLDDDITGITKQHLLQTTSTAAEIAGFPSTDFPDNSVVRHAERLSGTEPGVSLSASAMVADVTRASGFFPALYNADWLYPYDSMRRSSVCRLGPVIQEPYEPFENPARCGSEEFGDLLGEGIAQLWRHGVGCTDATAADWAHLISARHSLIDDISRRLDANGSPQARRATTALDAGRDRSSTIEPLRCVQYIAAWRRDLVEWHTRLAALQPSGSLREAVEQLKLGLETYIVDAMVVPS